MNLCVLKHACRATVFTLAMAMPLVTPLHAEESDTSTYLSVGGVFDSYYSVNLRHPGGRGTETGSTTIPLRYYDSESNSLTINTVEFNVLAQRDDFQLDAGFAFGPWAEAMASGDVSAKNIDHAVLTVDPWQNGVTFTVGKMYSHVGLEGARSSDNLNYSRSWIFDYGTPTWHTGVRIGYNRPNSNWSGALHMYNGWNSVHDNNAAKSLGLTIARKCGPLVATYNVLAGAEQPGNARRLRVVHDFNLTSQLASNLSLAVDMIAGSEPLALHADTTMHDANWYGAEAILGWSLHRTITLSARGEWYEDATGYTVGLNKALNLYGLTLTCSHQLANQLEIRLESRFDHADQGAYAAAGQNHRSQATVMTALLAKF